MLSSYPKGNGRNHKRNISTTEKLPGSSVSLYEDTGTYFPYERPVEILSKDKMELPDLYEWLDGAGELEIDDGGYYNARVLSVEPVTEDMARLDTADNHLRDPAIPLPGNSPTVALTSGQTVWNPGLVSDPYFKNHRNRICHYHYQRRIIHSEPNRPVH